MSNFLRAQTLRHAAKRHHALEDRRAPVLFADAHQFGNQRFYIVDRHQLTQQRLSVFPACSANDNDLCSLLNFCGISSTNADDFGREYHKSPVG